MFKKIGLWLKFAIADLVLRAKGIKIIEAKTEEEKKMVYRLRYKIYKDYDYINPKDFPDGEFKDEEDDRCISVLALKNKKPIGVISLILGDKKQDFPTIRAWNVDFRRFPVSFSEVGELSRLGVIEAGVKRSWIWLGMIKKIYEKGKRLGHRYWIFTTHTRVVNAVKGDLYISIYPLPLKNSYYNKKEVEKIIGLFYYHHMSPYFVKI